MPSAFHFETRNLNERQKSQAKFARIGAKKQLVSYEFEYFYQCIMTFWDQGTLRDPYGYIKTNKFKIAKIHC